MAFRITVGHPHGEMFCQRRVVAVAVTGFKVILLTLNENYVSTEW